jgi:arsenate reductase
MSDITVYEKPTCTTCRNLFTLLKEEGVDVNRVNYHVDGLTPELVGELLRKTGLGPRDVLRTREPEYAQHVAGPDLTDAELISLIAEHPALLQRPIVVRGDRAVLARPVEKVRELLS